MINFLSRFVQEDLSDFGNLDAADDMLLDVQTITDAMMTTAQKIGELGIRFALNLLVCWLLVHFFYYKKSRRRDYYFTFIVFSSAMLTLLYIMGNVEVGVGLTLGLFAIFGVIRYRTETVPIREMTYLFIIIALALVNAIAEGVPMLELILTNVIVVVAVWSFEHSLKTKPTKYVQYDRVELIVPERRDELKADLEKRLGVKVIKLEVGSVDFIRDMAIIRIVYEGLETPANKKLKLKNSELTDF